MGLASHQSLPKTQQQTVNTCTLAQLLSLGSEGHQRNTDTP